MNANLISLFVYLVAIFEATHGLLQGAAKSDFGLGGKRRLDTRPLSMTTDKESFKSKAPDKAQQVAYLPNSDEILQNFMTLAKNGKTDAIFPKVLNSPRAKRVLPGIEGKGKFGESFVQNAASSDGYRTAVSMLLDAAADNFVKDNSGRTALFHAIENGRKDLVFLLLEAGEADVNAKDKKRKTPLHYAAEKGCADIATMLLEAGADVTSKDESGATPLATVFDSFSWSLQERVLLISLLLDAGSNPNIKGRNGMTPLHRAAALGDGNVISLLLKAGADYSVKDKHGKTPLHYAAREGKVDTDAEDGWVEKNSFWLIPLSPYILMLVVAAVEIVKI